MIFLTTPATATRHRAWTVRLDHQRGDAGRQRRGFAGATEGLQVSGLCGDPKCGNRLYAQTAYAAIPLPNGKWVSATFLGFDTVRRTSTSGRPARATAGLRAAYTGCRTFGSPPQPTDLQSLRWHQRIRAVDGRRRRAGDRGVPVHSTVARRRRRRWSRRSSRVPPTTWVCRPTSKAPVCSTPAPRPRPR